MKQVKKAVVLLAGYGARCLPYTKVLPKAMIPILNKPIIAYIVEELEKTSLQEIVFVLAKDCNGKIVKEYFSSNKTYEKFLKKRNKLDFLKQLQEIKTNLKIRYVYNTKANGSGGALLSAKKYLKKEPFVLLNGDDIFIGKENAINQMLNLYKKVQKNIVVVQQVPEDKKSLYGIYETVKEQDYLKVIKMVEKPKSDEIKSNLAAVGRYLLEEDIFQILKKSKKYNGEILVTDALTEFIRQNKLNAVITKATRIDGGNTFEIAKAGVVLALQNNEYKEKMQEFLKTIKPK